MVEQCISRPTPPTVGSTIVVSVKIQNVGSAAIPAGWVLKIGVFVPGLGGYGYYSTPFAITISPGAIQTVHVSGYPIDPILGGQTADVIITMYDSQDEIVEYGSGTCPALLTVPVAAPSAEIMEISIS